MKKKIVAMIAAGAMIASMIPAVAAYDQSETAAHFHLSLSRARHTEKAALNSVRRALPG